MALILLDGCEDLTLLSGAFTVGPGRNGLCLRSPAAGSATLTYTIPVAQQSDTITFGFAMFTPSLSSTYRFVDMIATSQASNRFVLNVDGSITVNRGTAAPILTTAPGTISPNSWVYFECQIYLHDTAGFVTVRVNNTVVGSVTGVDTKPATMTAYEAMYFISSATGSSPGYMIDDLYLMAGAGDTFMGDMVIETLYPNGNGAVNEWTGSDGDKVNNYLLVNEVGSVNASSYTKDTIIGHRDLYTLSDLSLITGSILGVCHAANISKGDAGPASFKILHHGAVDTKSAVIPLTTGNVDYLLIFTVNPETGAPFTVAEVNALQSGVEVA